MKKPFVLLLGVLCFWISGAALSAPDDAGKFPYWASILDQVLARPGTLHPDGVYRVGISRSDLRVSRKGVPIERPMALTCWEAYRRIGKTDELMVMGDLVLLPSEVSLVVKKLLESGLQVTALHNHLVGEEPRLMYLHYEGRGSARVLASRLREALALTAIPRYQSATDLIEAREPNEKTMNAYRQIEQILGQEGRLVEKVLQVSFPRAEPVKCGKIEVPPSMGTAIALHFQPSPAGVAATGDFVLTDDEVMPVLQALRLGNIDVEAIHSHMLHETPTLKFVHFWAEGPAEKVAVALRAALDQVAIKR